MVRERTTFVSKPLRKRCRGEELQTPNGSEAHLTEWKEKLSLRSY